MDQTTHHYHVFETAGGFCGIAWSATASSRFRLPTKSAEAAERGLRRRTPGGEPRTPTPAVARAVAAAQRYFAGKRTDFSGVELDLGEQEAFFTQVYAAHGGGRGRPPPTAR